MEPIGLHGPQKDAFAVGAFRVGRGHAEQRPAIWRVIHHGNDHPIALPAQERRGVGAAIFPEERR